MQRLSPGAFGLAVGILWGAGVFLVMFVNLARPAYGREFVHMLMSIYPGVIPTPLGAALGLLWGFVDGVICGVLLAWIYNGLARPEPAPAAPAPPVTPPAAQ